MLGAGRTLAALSICILAAVGTPRLESADFIRGDANRDRIVDVSDAVITLRFLLLGNPATLECPDAADTNDDGLVDVSDAITTLAVLFLGVSAIPEPSSCGEDPTADGLECESFEVCEDGAPFARVTAATVIGPPGAKTFSVTVESPDTGCDQYADWWEVVSPDGELLYRRILLHSHTTEQPFTRGGGPVEIDADTEVLVRAHMNTVGYGTQALRGSEVAGFESVELEPGFAAGLAEEEPLPEGCAF